MNLLKELLNESQAVPSYIQKAVLSLRPYEDMFVLDLVGGHNRRVTPEAQQAANDIIQFEMEARYPDEEVEDFTEDYVHMLVRAWLRKYL